MEFRKYKQLDSEIEDTVWELRNKAFEILNSDNVQAENIIKKAWNIIPEPKFDWGSARVTLHDYVKILNFNSKIDYSITLLDEEIKDLGSAGFKVIDTSPYILIAETYLHKSNVIKAQEYFGKAYIIGKARGFQGYPELYLDLVNAKAIDENDTIKKFNQLEINKKLIVNIEETETIKDILDEDYENIEALSEEGNQLFDEGKYAAAINIWRKALEIIPNPKNLYEASLWLYSSIGDAFFQLKDFKNSSELFYDALNCPDGYSNPFILLRLGQSLCEINDNKNGKQYLLKAYMLEGKELFENEDTKYFKVIESIV